MTQVTYKVCDIKGCSNKTERTIQIHVKFLTEQTEGRNVKPYLSKEKLDICDTHLEEILDKEKLIKGSGAMGYNTYYL